MKSKDYIFLLLIILLSVSLIFSVNYFNKKIEETKTELNKKLDETNNAINTLSNLLETAKSELNQKLDDKTTKSEVLSTLNKCRFYSGDYDGQKNIPRKGDDVCKAYQQTCIFINHVEQPSGLVVVQTCDDGGISDKFSAYCCSI